MSFNDLLKWQLAPAHFISALGFLAAVAATRFLYRAFLIRTRFRKLKASGIPILPHSMIYGHMGIMADFRRVHPPDINHLALPLWLARNFKRYFPDLEEVPPVIYLDLWPFRGPFAFVNNVDMARQLTQTSVLPRSQLQTQFFTALTGNKDLFSMGGSEWKIWRTRFNPGFSPRNITAMIPEIIDEVLVFTRILEDNAGAKGSWGPSFQLAKTTTNLTLDVIVRAVTDKRLHEQTTPDGTSLRNALFDTLKLGLLTLPKPWFSALRTIHKQPGYKTAISHNTRVMRDALNPPIEKIIKYAPGSVQKKTVVKIAWDQITGEKDKQRKLAAPDPAVFADVIVNHLKVFLFAGYDTTATTLCWMFKMLQDNPECMVKLREEHDEVLGKDLAQLPELLKSSPHLLNSLPYTVAVIKETLRLESPAGTVRQGAPGFFLAAPGLDTKYPTEGFAMADGAHWIHLDPQTWPRSNEFLPQRWLVSNEDPLHPVPSSWRPFGLGPRNCIGQELAMTEIKLVAVLVVRKFDIQEAWNEWDEKMGPNYPRHTYHSERLYPTGFGPAHLKDDMPVHLRLR